MRSPCNHESLWKSLAAVRWPLLMALLLVALTAGGCVVSPLAADEPVLPEPVDRTVPVIAIAPVTGPPGSTLFVSGAGWRADEVIYVNLEGERDAERVEGTVAIATADGDGRFTVAFVFPVDEFWTKANEIAVVAYSLDTGDRASAPFALMPLAETPTPTVTPTPAPEASRPAPRPPSDQARVTSAGLNLRAGPSMLFPVIRELRHGAVLTVLGQNPTGYWLYVQTVDGTLGWVARPFTDFRSTAPEVSPPPLPPGGQPSPTATPTFTAWRGQYFANMDLAGAPVLTRNDMAVKFDWGHGSPGPNVPNDRFSARWTRTLVFPEGTHRFFATSDDGVRVWIDGRLIIDEWHDATGRTYSAELFLPAGPYEVRVEYYERTQLANISVWWQIVSGFPEWRGEYFANQDLAGNPQRVRNDAAIDFDWGFGSPAPDIPADRFSVRWLRGLHFDAGTYRFRISTDDGMRIFVDDRLIIDEWRTGSVRERTADLWLDAGVHNLRVEYYEETMVAVAKVSWERVQTPGQSFPDWKGEYFANRRLDGSPSHVRNDDEIDFNWGTSRPAPGIPSTNFSVRWTREVDFSAGTYRFYARADDGIRAWVDGERIIDEWQDSRGEVIYTADRYLDGDEDVRVEYYQREGGALAEFWWERLSATSTPTHTPTPTRTPTATPVTRTPTPTATRAPYADVNPASGPAGTDVTVSCGGFPPNTALNLYLGAYVTSARAAASAQPIATGSTDRFGACSFRTTVPDAWPDGRPVEPGRLTYLVATANFAVSAAADFDLVEPRPTDSRTPYLDISPSSGGAGTRVDARGGGFPANATVSLYLGEIVRTAAADAAPPALATAKADSRGNFATSFAMPGQWPGGGAIESGKLIVLAATGDFAVEASATFDYFVDAPNPSISLKPTSGGPGTSVTVSGGGFLANTQVGVYLATLGAQVDDGDAHRFASGSTDRNGRVSLTFRMPDAWPDGSPVLAEELVVTVATADFSVAASAVFDYAPPAPTSTPTITATPTHTPTPTKTPVNSPTPTPNPFVRLNPRAGGEGTTVTASGGGFPANTTVYVYLASFDGGSEGGAYERYATAATDGAGDYAAAFVMPGAWSDGRPIDTGRIAVLVATEDFGAQASATFSYAAAAAAAVEPAVATVTPTPTATDTPEAPTFTPTATMESPTATPTNTPQPPPATATNTPEPPPATATNTPTPPTATPQPPPDEEPAAPPPPAATPLPEPEQGSEAP